MHDAGKTAEESARDPRILFFDLRYTQVSLQIVGFSGQGGPKSFAKKAGWKGRRRTCRKERVVVKRVVKCLRAYFGNRINILSLILVFVNLPHLTKVWKEGGTDGQVCRERDTAGLSLSFA